MGAQQQLSIFHSTWLICIFTVQIQWELPSIINLVASTINSTKPAGQKYSFTNSPNNIRTNSYYNKNEEKVNASNKTNQEQYPPRGKIVAYIISEGFSNGDHEKIYQTMLLRHILHRVDLQLIIILKTKTHVLEIGNRSYFAH